MLAALLAVIMLGIDPSPVAVHAGEFTKTDLQTLATAIALSHNLDVGKFLKTIECESRWNPKAKGDYRDGQPTSFGLVQLRFPEKDWGITVKQAYEPLRSMEIMADAWQAGKMRKWSCYPKGEQSP